LNTSPKQGAKNIAEILAEREALKE